MNDSNLSPANLYLIMELDKDEVHEEILIYDIESQNNEPPLHVRDDPEPEHQESCLQESVDVLQTKTVQIRSISPFQLQQTQQEHFKSDRAHNQAQKQINLELKEQPKKLLKKQEDQQKQKHPQRKHFQNDNENIIFYDEDLLKSTTSIQYNQSTRGLLKNVLESSDDEDSDEYDDEVDNIQEIATIGKVPKKGNTINHNASSQNGRSRSVVPNNQSESAVSVEANVDVLLQQLLPPAYKLRCYLTIQRGLLGFASTYRLFLGEEKQFLMSAKKETFKYYSNFLISKHPKQIHKRSEYFIGRLQANFVGTEFKLFSIKEKIETLTIEVTYNKNIVGFMGPRIFSVVKVNPAARPSKYGLNTLSSILERSQHSKLLKLQTVEPVLIRGKYRLNFDGKVRIPSSKNFILEGDALTKGNSLLFGKISEDCYMMEVAYPLTIFEGFGICLTSLDSKIMVN